MAFEYVEGDTIFHRMDPRTKLFIAVSVVAMSVVFNDPIWLFLLLVFLIFLLKLAHMPFDKVGGFIRAIAPVAVLYFLFNIIIPPLGGKVQNPLILAYIYKNRLPISLEGLVWAVGAVFRFLIILTIIRTVLMLTPIRDLILALVKLRIPPEFALAISIGLGYLPVMLDENRKIMEAQMARGWDFRFRNPIKRFKALFLNLFWPAISNSMRRSQDIAIAIESRGFGYNIDGRTYMHDIRWERRDYSTFALFLLLIVGAWIGKRFFKIADYTITAEYIRNWLTTSVFQSWFAKVTANSPFKGLLLIIMFIVLGLICGLIGGLVSRRGGRLVALLCNLVITLPLLLAALYMIIPVLPPFLELATSIGTDQLLQRTFLVPFLVLILIVFGIAYVFSWFGIRLGRTGRKKVHVPT